MCNQAQGGREGGQREGGGEGGQRDGGREFAHTFHIMFMFLLLFMFMASFGRQCSMSRPLITSVDRLSH